MIITSCLLLFYYFQRQKARRDPRSLSIPRKKLAFIWITCMKLTDYLLKINQKINAHAKKFAFPYFTFAIFGIITYPFYYFIWKITDSNGYENLELRLITVFFCILLSLKNYWPKKWQLFFPLFWYITLLYPP